MPVPHQLACCDVCNKVKCMPGEHSAWKSFQFVYMTRKKSVIRNSCFVILHILLFFARFIFYTIDPFLRIKSNETFSVIFAHFEYSITPNVSYFTTSSGFFKDFFSDFLSNCQSSKCYATLHLALLHYKSRHTIF